MKIIQTKEKTSLVEMTYDELRLITTFYKYEVEKCCNNSTEIKLVGNIENFSRTSEDELKRTIEAIDGAAKFLNNQLKSIYEFKKLKS